MATPPLISIVTVNRDDAAGLHATLRSAERLRYPALEQIVVDGASEDGSVEIARDFSHWIDRLISEPDDGVYQAMNKGAAAARGDWVIFMNAGDRFAAPDVLDALPLTGGADIIHGRARAAEAGHVRDYAEALWQGMAFCHQAALTRSAWLQRFAFDEAQPVVSDWEFFVKCERAGARFEGVGTVIAEVDATGRSYSNPAGRAAQRLPIALRHYRKEIPGLKRYYKALMRDAGDRA